MDKKKFYFYISGIISLLFLIGVFFLFVYVLLFNEKIKSYAFNKDNFVSVSVVIPKQVKKNRSKKSDKPKKEVIKESKKVEEEFVETDLDSLFSNVTTKSISKKTSKKKSINDKKDYSKMVKKISTKKKNSVKSSSTMVENIKVDISKIELNTEVSSSANEVNEYLASIQAYVYENFFPPISAEGNSAKVRIWIDENGHLSRYVVLTYSSDDGLNYEVDLLESRLRAGKFPIAKKPKAINIDIILTAKNQT